MRGGLEEALALWAEALATDGGGPEPRAHRLVLDLLAEQRQREVDGERHRALYIEAVAAVDLDAQAAPQIAQWLRERLESDEPVEAWIALLRALGETPETEQVANALLSERAEPPTSVEAVIEVAHELEERLEEKAWRRRRRAKMTADEPSPIETC